MEQYISKSALVAEIESKFQKYWKIGEDSDALQDGNAKYWGGVLSCLNEVKTLIETLEVKEVDEEYNGKAMLHVLEKGVKQGKRDLIEKACEFFTPYIPDNSGGYDRASVIEQFKKAMEE